MTFKRHSIAFLAFVGLACLAMYWIIFNLSTSMPGNIVTDYYHFHWNYWWVRHVLTTPGLNIYETNYVFAPATSSLALHTLSLIWYPIWAIFEPIGGTFFATAVISVIAFALNGYLFFVLLRREGVSYGLAFVGGAMLELSPMLFTAFGNPFWNLNITKPVATVPLLIYTYATGPYEDWHQKAWAASFVLLVVVLITSVMTRAFLRGKTHE